MSPTFDLTIASMSNELDGDPDLLDKRVAVFRRNATALDNSAKNLERIRNGSSSMKSEAFEALAGKVHEVETGIRSAAFYYSTIADAVAGFSPVLREAQRQAPGHLEAAHAAQFKKLAAHGDYETARTMARNVDPQTRQQGIDLANKASARYNNADASLTAARNALKAAADTVLAANNAAAAKVANASEKAGLKDSFWDKVAKIGKAIAQAAVAIAEFVWENLDLILVVLTVASFCIPGVGAGVMALKVLSVAIKGVTLLSKAKKIIEGVQTGWEAVSFAASGDYEGAGRKALSLGVTLAMGKLAKVAGKRLGEVGGKELFGLDEHGNLHSTATGRFVNRVLNKVGPQILDADGTSPDAFISQSIDRTTKVITEVTAWSGEKDIKKVTKFVTDKIEAFGVDVPGSAAAPRVSGGGSGGGGGGGR